MILTSTDRFGTFRAYGGLNAIEDFSDREIVITYDPAREKSLNGLPLPSVDLNLSGCSGGPVLLHGLRNGLHRWFPVGLICGGPMRNGVGEIDLGEVGAFAMIRAVRIHRLEPDGTIKKQEFGGWLP